MRPRLTLLHRGGAAPDRPLAEWERTWPDPPGPMAAAPSSGPADAVRAPRTGRWRAFASGLAAGLALGAVLAAWIV